MMLRWLAVLSAGVLLSGCQCGNETNVLECMGTCTCDEATRTCSCNGGTDCVVEGASDITFICEGNSRCDLECGDQCRVECPGTAGCIARLGDDSTAVCNGTASCDFACAGNCSVDCPGTSECLVHCGGACEITSCGADVMDCGDGYIACRTACPAEGTDAGF